MALHAWWRGRPSNSGRRRSEKPRGLREDLVTIKRVHSPEKPLVAPICRKDPRTQTCAMQVGCFAKLRGPITAETTQHDQTIRLQHVSRARCPLARRRLPNVNENMLVRVAGAGVLLCTAAFSDFPTCPFLPRTTNTPNCCRRCARAPVAKGPQGRSAKSTPAPPTSGHLQPQGVAATWSCLACFLWPVSFVPKPGPPTHLIWRASRAKKLHRPQCWSPSRWPPQLF